MAQKIYRIKYRQGLFLLLLVCLLPLMGQLLSHSANGKTCPKCNAVLTIVDQYDATCTVNGSIVYKCNECNNHVEIVTIPLQNHSWKKQSETSATCLESATATYRCRNCGLEEVRTVEDSQPLGHDYVETIVSPSCSTEGYTLHTCSRCEDSYQTDSVAKLQHTYSQEIIQTPTCENVGYCRNICTTCAFYETVEMPRTDHSWIAQTVEPTHTEQGYTSYTCQYCGAGHRDDLTEYKPYEMVWTTQEATCTEGGFRIGVCSDGCGHTETVFLPLKGHEFGEWEVIRRPDENSEGLESHSCVHCKYTETRLVLYTSEEIQQEPKQITPMMILIAAFLLIITLGLMILILLLLLENSGKRKKKSPQPTIDSIE